jgi:hypothetical protein
MKKLILCLLLSALASPSVAAKAQSLEIDQVRSDSVVVIGCDVDLQAIVKIEVDYLCSRHENVPCSGTETLKIVFVSRSEGGSHGICRTYFTAVDLETGSFVAMLIDPVAKVASFGPLPQAEVPAELNLESYPNPFNAVTTILYSLPYSAHVKLEVYNLLGQVAASLENGVVPEGSHTAVWDGTSMASGWYIVQMNINGKMLLTRKVLLLK